MSRSRESEEYPVPKSSIAIEKPWSVRSVRIRCARSGSIIAEDSVTSTITRVGSSPLTRISRTIRSARSGCQNCRGERLNPTSRSIPSSFQAVTW